MARGVPQEIVFRRFSYAELAKHRRLIRRTFGTDTDPNQIPPDPEYVKKILALSRDCLLYANERRSGQPVGEAFAFPTTRTLMQKFLARTITERQLLEQTPLQQRYGALYCCSVLVVPRWQRKGIGTELLVRVVSTLMKHHSHAQVFCWTTSPAGRRLVSSLERRLALRCVDRSQQAKRLAS